MKDFFVGFAIIGVVVLFCSFFPYFVSGNADIFDGMNNKSNTWTYAEVRMPDGTIKEGKITKWADYESDALKLIFEDGTELITSYNCAVLSKDKVQR